MPVVPVDNKKVQPPAAPIRARVRTGGDLDSDERISPLYSRESFFLSVLIPRKLSYKNGARATFIYLSSRSTWPFLLLAAAVFSAVTAVCATSISDAVCSGGPLDDGGNAIFLSYYGYWPGILNSLGVLLLSFYGSTCLTRYIGAYDSCQSLKGAVVDIVTCAVGSVEPSSPCYPLVIEIWRAANLVQLCTYVLADKHRTTYSFDNFVVPVAEHYGFYDGKEHLGMLRAHELVALRSQVAARSTSSLTNKRGDVQSKAAILYSALNVRLIALVRKAIKNKTTLAPWPIWGPALRNLRSTSNEVKQRALFRIPRVYRVCVRLVVFTTLLCDTFVLGANAGRLFRAEYEYGFAWLSLVLIALLDALVVSTATLLVSACVDMENPFGSDLLDMPALSYVTGTAETTLAMLPAQEGHSDSGRTLNRLTAMAYLQEVNLEKIMAHAPERYAPSFTRSSISGLDEHVIAMNREQERKQEEANEQVQAEVVSSGEAVASASIRASQDDVQVEFSRRSRLDDEEEDDDE